MDIFKDREEFNRCVLNYVYEHLKSFAEDVGDLATFDPSCLTEEQVKKLGRCPSCGRNTIHFDGTSWECSNCDYVMPFSQVIKILRSKDD